MKQKHRNEYDETKELLQRIRKLNNSSKRQIEEQINGTKPHLNDYLGDEESEKIKQQPSDEYDNWEPPKSDQPSNWGTPSDKPEAVPGDDPVDTPEDVPNPDTEQSEPEKEENKDYNVVNNVEIVINSTDPADLELNDDEKIKVSQLIDDFRSEVSEITEFGQLNIYDDNAKLDGNLGEINLGFTLSAGDDNGVYLSNTSMVQLNDNILEFINKLKTFQVKFNDVLNELIANRQQN